MSQTPILLLGAGGHARACIDVIEQEGRFVVAGLIGIAAEVGTRVLGYSVVGTDSDLPRMLPDYPAAMVTIGQITSAGPRVRLFEMLERSGCERPVVVSPLAYVSPHAKIGAGSIVLHGAVVNAGAVIGRNCILNSQSLVEHDALVGDHCHIATGAIINGGVRVGARTFVGSNSTVRQEVVVEHDSLVPMGRRVTADSGPRTWFE